MRMGKGAAAPCSTPVRAATTFSRWDLRPIAATASSISTAARCSRPVTAADVDPAALAALGAAARATAGLKPVTAEIRDLFRRPLAEPELKSFDAAIFDPPRQGALAQAQKLAGSGVPVVIAVSCNAATFARDARILIDGGYRLEAVTPVDQFRYTPHVEIVARFAR